MDSRYSGDPQFLRRFEFEARAVAGLKHPGLVAVYDQGIDNGIAFLVMELVDGGSLREPLRANAARCRPSSRWPRRYWADSAPHMPRAWSIAM